ncbi:unnamed protein product [Aphanomyces euteiches]
MRILTALALAASVFAATEDPTGPSGSAPQPYSRYRAPITSGGVHERKYREKCSKIGAACGKFVGAVGSSVRAVVQGHDGTRLGVAERVKIDAHVGGLVGKLKGQQIGGKLGAKIGKWKDQQKYKSN